MDFQAIPFWAKRDLRGFTRAVCEQVLLCIFRAVFASCRHLTLLLVCSTTGHFLSELGPANREDPGTEQIAGAQVLGSDKDALELRRPDSATLKILDAVKDYSSRLNNVIGRMRKEFDKSGDMVKSIVPESKLMRTVFAGMTLTCSRSDEQDPMKRDGPPLKDWQDSYGEQLVIDQTVSLLQLLLVEWELSILEIKEGMYGESTFLAMKLMMRFLRAVVKKHYPNQIRASKYLSWLGDGEQLALPLAVVDTVASIYDDNKTLLEKVTDEAITELVDLMVELHRSALAAPRFVDLLRMMCTCHGTAVPSNQNKICAHFLQNTVMHCHLKMMPVNGQPSAKGGKKKKKDKGTKAPSTGNKDVPHIAAIGIDREEWIPLTLFVGKTSGILKKALPDCNPEERLYRYHIQSLRLFCAACMGRNRGCTDYLLTQASTLGLTMDGMFTILKDDVLPPFYRGLVADVIVALYIDREPNEGIAPINKIRIWQACDPPVNKRAQKTKVDPFANFPELRPTPGFPDLVTYLGIYYEGTGGSFTADTNKNSMISTMICISYTLLDFGFYHDEHMVPDMPRMAILLDPLLSLLDGRKTQKDDSDLSRFKFSDKTAPIWDARLNILKILEFAFDCRVDKRLAITYDMYEKALDKQFAANNLNSLLGTADQVAADMSFTATPWKDQQLKDLAENLFNKPLIPTKTSLAMSTDIMNPSGFVKTLLDNILMDSVQLNVFALSLLNRHYGQRSSMIKIMQNVQIVVFEDVAILRYELAAAVSEVRRNLKWLMATGDADRAKGFKAIHNILDRCIELTTQNNVCAITEGAPTTITATEVGKFQAMLLNLGMHTKIFAVLAMPFIEDNEEGMALWIKCYQFFSNFVNKNPKNQGQIFEHLILFQKHMMMAPLTNVCADAIASILRNNKQLLEKIDDRLYLQMFKAIQEHRQAACLSCLETTVSLNGERHIRNSGMLMKRLASNGTIFAWWDGANGRELLIAAMLDACAGAPEDLNWHLAGLHLMATLCAGKAPDNEVKAQGIMSYFHILERSTMFNSQPPDVEGRDPPNPDIWLEVTIRVKKANLHFMTEVFITSQTEDALNVLKSFGAKVWPHHQILEASVKLQRLWMLKLKRKLGFHVSDVSASFPRTLIQEAIVSLHAMSSIAKQVDGQGAAPAKKGKKEKKKKKKSADEDMEDLLDGVVPVNMDTARATADYVFKYVLPFVTAVLGDQYDPDTAPPIRRLLAITVSNLVVKLSTSSFAKAGYQRYIDGFMKIVEEKGLIQLDDEEEDDSPVVPNKIIFKEGWGVFIQEFAKVIGIADLKRVLGAGIKNLALMLSKNMIPDSRPLMSFRQIVFRMYDTLAKQPKELKAALSTDLLRIARAMVFVEDPIEPEDEERIATNWGLFIVDGPPEKSEPARANFKYVQAKYANLQAGGAVAVCLAIPDPPTAMAAVRLGMTLLEHGNFDAQMALLKFLQRTQNSEFFYRLSCNIKEGCNHVKDWMKFVRTQKEMATRRTKRSGGAMNAVNPAAAAMGGTCITMRFLQMMCEGHNLEVQDFIRDQNSNSISYNLVGEAIVLLTQIALAFRFAIDNRVMDLFPMLIQVMDFITETMQGSCLANQDECSSNAAMSTYSSLIQECKYINGEGSEDEDTVTVAGEDMTIRMIKCEVKTAVMTLLFSILEENYEDRITTHFTSNIQPSMLLDDIIMSLDPETGALAMETKQGGGETHNFDGEGASTDGPDASGADAIRDQGRKAYLVLKMMEDRVADEEHPVRVAVQNLKKSTAVNKICTETCGQIEILRNKKVYRTHFITPDFVIEIKKRMVFFKRCQEKFEAVPRSNPDEKVVVMNKNMKVLVAELDHMNALVTDERTRDLVAYSDFVQDKPLLLAVMTIAWMVLFYGDPEDPYNDYGVWAEIVAHLLALCQFGITCVWLAIFWLIQAPMVAVYPKHQAPKPTPSAPAPVKGLGESLEPYEIPLPPMPVRDPGESAGEKKVRIQCLMRASKYHLTYTIISFVALCGGPGLHWMLTFWCKYMLREHAFGMFFTVVL